MSRTTRGAWLLALLLVVATQAVAASSGLSMLERFRAAHGPEWEMTRGTDGRPRRLIGGALRWREPGGSPDDETMLALARAFAREHGDLLGLESDGDLLEPPQAVVATADGTIRVIRLALGSGAVPIDGARVTFVVNRGALVAVHVVGSWTGPHAADATPRVPADLARRRALLAAGFDEPDVAFSPPALLWLRGATSLRLAWRCDLIATTLPPRRVRVDVDARSGEVVALSDELVEACDPVPPAGPSRRALGGVKPESPRDSERVEMLPFVTVGAAAADGSGTFARPAPPYAGVLEGPRVDVECVSCNNPVQPLAPANGDGDVDFGMGGVDAAGNGTSTPSDRTAYAHSESIKRFASRWLALPFVTGSLRVRTNIASSCNAYWDGSALNFFRSGGACANTGEIRDVIDHEWGHGLDENDGAPPPGLSVDGATGEAVADIVAMLRSRDACIGEGFFVDPADGPSAGCDGVRDLDELAVGHRRGSPATLGTGNVAALCPPSGGYRGPLGREGHCEGEILGQAFWHLARNLIDGVSLADGSPLPDGPLPADEAWQVLESLFFRSKPLLESYAPSTLQSIGMSAHDAFLLADDEGDGIANGTPHAAAILEALAHHGLLEAGVPPPDTAACAGPADPVVTVTAETDPASGLPGLRIDWTDVAGATDYRVLRQDDPDDAYLAASDVIASGVGTWRDAGVLPARTYRYVVAASDAAGCVSPGRSPVAGSPGALLVVVAARIDDSGSPSPDGRLEAGETADLLLDLSNRGSAPASNLAVTIASLDPGLVVLAPGPMAYGTIAPGASVTAPAPFRVQALASVPRQVAVTVSGEADEGCLRAETLLDMATADLLRAGEILDDSTGNADGTWDSGETIDLSLPLRNDGTLDARAVTATLSFRGAPTPGVTIVQPAASYPDVAPGATQPTAPPLFQLVAAGGMPPRTRVPLSLDVSLGGSPHRRYDVNLTVGRFVPGTFEWTYQPVPGRWIVEVTPLVLQLTDDDGDGIIGKCDVPDVVVVEARSGGTSNALIALSGDDGRVHWELEEPCTQVGVFAAMAGGDVDRDGYNEIVTAVSDRWDCAISHDGAVKWRVPSQVPAGQSFSSGTHELSVWDLDGDGSVEIVAGHSALRGEDGTFEWSQPRTNDRVTIVADLDLDGSLEVIAAGNQAYRADGSPHALAAAFRGFNSVPSVGNLDADPHPEIVQEFAGDVQCREHDGTLKWERADLPGSRGATGPTALADVDGDGMAEVVVQCLSEILMLEEDGSTKWSMPIGDISGSSGMSLFDFDGDGPPEIVFRDHSRLWVFDALDGQVLWETPMASGTAYEFPVIADVDADGQAEMIVLDGFVGGNERVRCIGNAPWPPARSVWNQEAYSINHVEENGVIVSSFAPRWLSGNDFRAQAVSCPCAGPAPAPTWARVPDCASSALCFAANVAGGVPPHRATWDFGDGSPPQDGLAPCHSFPAPGGYVVRLRIEDASGCPGEWSAWVDVPAALTADFVPPSACRGRDACVTASVAGARAPVVVEWDFGDGSARVAGPSACHAYAASGTFTAWMLVTDADGCSRDVPHDIVVGAPPRGVGGGLRVRDHGDPLAPGITAVLDWSLDEGAPRPAGEGHVVLRGTSPTGLVLEAGPLPLATTFTDSTPRSPLERFVHFYVVLAEDACGVRSDD